ncbi:MULTISPECIES: hypothetical protein [unclassified Agreia]|uniref:hypothetical protein n=1 Tax=unclassified Agreia TaxID=2641148 RepID=UPI0006FE9DB2|nr:MULTISPECIES: hypothetical protein [unclassified Agreia]KQM59529.1 hypothetical protein ASE64_09285 [Agreia sp. Leaf210]KQR20174.1 hypothetical protein ASF79_11415 [Agreia sp. Leaf335]
MANAGSKCPACSRTVAVGIVSQTLVQHEDKTGFRCAGSGTSPGAARPAAAPRKASASATARTSTPAAKRTSPPTKGGVTVRRVEVNQEELARRQEKQERIREERAAAARERNDANISYFDELR